MNFQLILSITVLDFLKPPITGTKQLLFAYLNLALQIYSSHEELHLRTTFHSWNQFLLICQDEA